MNSDIRILIVDDHALLRRALGERLQREPGFAVVGNVSNADEAIETATKNHVNVILMDIDMPGLSCFDAARRILLLRPETRILFLSAFSRDQYIEQALAVKAGGYLTKCDPPEVVLAAIREVASGGVYFSDEIRSRIVVQETGVKLASKPHSRLSKLTVRELEVLRYIASGMGQKEIAATMNVSVKTVDNHSANLMGKLDIHDRVELTRFAIREGLAEA